MHITLRHLWLMGVVCWMLPIGSSAQKGESGNQAEGKPAAEKKRKPEPLAEPKVTLGEVTLANGETLSYRAKAGVLRLETEKEEPEASMFSVAYTVDPEPGEGRPVMFCFNGGPGSSAVWLHLGILGPRRVDLPGDGTTAPDPPYEVVENAETALAAADLVFVDPVSTGYSRAVKEKEAKKYHGYEQDVSSVSEFIRRWVTENGRWASPKFLIGESYGAIRVSGVAERLQSRFGMYLNGVVLLSGLLDFATLREARGNDLPYIAFLPSYTATAHYFGKLEEELQELSREEAIEQARQFALGEYATALLAGARLSPADRESTVAQVARFTGLTPETVDRSRLRVDPGHFRKRLFWTERELIGRFDGRVKAAARDESSSWAQADPSLNIILGAYSGAMKAYLREQLQYESKLTYEILSPRVHPWSYEPFENRYVNVANTLRKTLLANDHLRVLVLCGYQDLATPFGGMEHSIAQMNLPTPEEDRVTFRYYKGGHMMYTVPASRKAAAADVESFIAGEQ